VLLSSPSDALSQGDSARRLVGAINAARSAGGCCTTGECFEPAATLLEDSSLSLAARRHATDLSLTATFDHASSNGALTADRLLAAGYQGCSYGEDLALGIDSAAAVVDAWLASPTHCPVLLEPAFADVGIAVTEAPGGTLWVADFGG